MRDLLVLLAVAATIPLSFYRPFYGLLSFSWLAYMRPQDLAWGLAASLPLSKFVALAIWISLIMRGKINIFRPHSITFALLALWVWLLVVTLLADHQNVAMEKFTDISKVYLIAFLSVVLITTRDRFKMTLAVIGLSLGFLGLKFGLFGILRGGVHFTKGVGGMIGDNNDFALALNMTLPLLVWLATQLEHRWQRLIAMVLIPMTAITVIFTYSRGGFLALAAVVLYMVLRSRRPLATTLLVGALALVGSQVVPASFYERMGTISNYEEDSSSQGRLNAWAASISMANDHPVFGVGLDNFVFSFKDYAPNPEDVHVAHNTYLQVLAETGYTGLLLYTLLFILAFAALERVRRRAKRYHLKWAYSGSKYLVGSLLAFAVGGTFLNRAHFDLTYHVIILACCLDRIVAVEIANIHAQWDHEQREELAEALLKDEEEKKDRSARTNPLGGRSDRYTQLAGESSMDERTGG